MAVYNEIGIGRWNRFIQKITDIKGSPPARQLASEIVFQHPIFSGQENRYLESWDRFGAGIVVGPIAAQNSGFRLTNPTGSNVIIVVEKACVSVATISTITFEYGTVGAQLSNAAVTIPMETRGRTASTGKLSFNVAALSTLNVVTQLQANVNVPYELEPTTRIDTKEFPPRRLTVSFLVSRLNGRYIGQILNCNDKGLGWTARIKGDYHSTIRFKTRHEAAMFIIKYGPR